MGLETPSYILGLASVGSDCRSMSSVCWHDWNSKYEPIFQPITTVLSKMVSFRGIGQMKKLMWWAYRCGYASKVQGLKIALVLFVERFLFGANYRKTVSPWLFTLAEDLEQFNSFSWGKFVFQMTLHYLNNVSHSPKPGKD